MNEPGIEDLINSLYDMIQEARAVPFSSEKCVLDREKALDFLDEISSKLPGELKEAKTIVDSRAEVINNTKRERENILKEAQNQARQMIAEEVVTKQANAEAEALLRQAQSDSEAMLRQAQSDSEAMLRQAQTESEAMVQKAQARIRELKKVTNDYVDNALRTSEQSISEALGEIRETRKKFNAVVGAQTKPEHPAIIENVD